MKMIQPTLAICLALLCITAAWAELDCSDVGQLFPADPSFDSGAQGFSVQTMSLEQPSSTGACDRRGVLKITLPTAIGGVQRYKLWMRFTLNSPSGPTFHIGDTDENAGNLGLTSSVYSAEVFSNGNELKVHRREIQQSRSVVTTRTGTISGLVTMIIGDDLAWVNNGITPAQQNPYTGHNDLFALKGQTDYDIYIGLNRLIWPNDLVQAGMGLCNVKIHVLDCQASSGAA